jgi:hypoxanthine-guanine phosphoribosyltransferase
MKQYDAKVCNIVTLSRRPSQKSVNAKVEYSNEECDKNPKIALN